MHQVCGCNFAVWAYGLIRGNGEMNAPGVAAIQEDVRKLPIAATITDLYVEPVGKGKFSCILAISVREKVEPAFIKQALSLHAHYCASESNCLRRNAGFSR